MKLYLKKQYNDRLNEYMIDYFIYNTSMISLIDLGIRNKWNPYFLHFMGENMEIYGNIWKEIWKFLRTIFQSIPYIYM